MTTIRKQIEDITYRLLVAVISTHIGKVPTKRDIKGIMAVVTKKYLSAFYKYVKGKKKIRYLSHKNLRYQLGWVDGHRSVIDEIIAEIAKEING